MNLGLELAYNGKILVLPKNISFNLLFLFYIYAEESIQIYFVLLWRYSSIKEYTVVLFRVYLAVK